MKKIFSLVMTLVFMICMIPVAACAYEFNNPFTNCTGVCWQKTKDTTGISLPMNWGNGADWYGNAANAGYQTIGPDEIPPANSIACWNGGLNGWGHVGYVVSADANGATIYEGGTGSTPTNTWMSYNTLKNQRYGGTPGVAPRLYLQGYIVLKNGGSSPSLTFTNVEAKNETQNSAEVACYIRNPNGAVVTEVGCYFRTGGVQVKKHSEKINDSYTQTHPIITLSIKTKEEAGMTLKSGTAYQFQFYAVVGGKEYLSENFYVSTLPDDSDDNSTSETDDPPYVPTYASITMAKESFAAGEPISFVVHFGECCGWSTNPYTISIDGKAYIAENGQTIFLENEQSLSLSLEPGVHTLMVIPEKDPHPADCLEYLCASATFTVEEEADQPSVADFTDIKPGQYFYNAVQWAVENSITSGINKTHFGPDQPCTRAQAVTFLWRAAGSPTVSGESSFSDVPSSAYYYDAVSWAVKKGITSGTGGGKFSPDARCTRGQIVTFLYRFAGKPGFENDTHNAVDCKTGDYYYEAVHWAMLNGITSGTKTVSVTQAPVGTIYQVQFSPNAACTRAQIVTFLYRYMG